MSFSMLSMTAFAKVDPQDPIIADGRYEESAVIEHEGDVKVENEVRLKAAEVNSDFFAHLYRLPRRRHPLDGSQTKADRADGKILFLRHFVENRLSHRAAAGISRTNKQNV